MTAPEMAGVLVIAFGTPLMASYLVWRAYRAHQYRKWLIGERPDTFIEFTLKAILMVSLSATVALVIAAMLGEVEILFGAFSRLRGRNSLHLLHF